MSLAYCDGGRWPLAPAVSAGMSCSVRAGDNPYRHARALGGWRREILQLSAGPFAGRVSEVAGGGCRSAAEFLSRSAFHIGPAYPGGLTLGVVDGAGGALWNGVRVGSDCVLCAFGDLEMVLRTYDNACLHWLFVPQAALAGYRALRELVDAQKHAAALCLSDRGLAERLRRCADGLPAPSMAVEIGDIAARFVHGYLAGTPLLNEVTYDTPFGDGYLLGTFVHRAAKLGDGVVVFLHDVTEARRMEAELKAYADVVASAGGEVNRFAWAPSRRDRVYFATSSGQVWRSDDDGARFTRVSDATLPGGNAMIARTGRSG